MDYKNLMIVGAVLVVVIIIIVVVVKMKKEKFVLNGSGFMPASGTAPTPMAPLTYLTADASGNLSTTADGSFANISATGGVYLNGYPGNVGDVIVSNGPTTPPVWAAGVGLSDFSSILKTPGYQKLPGGLIIQWGLDVTAGTALTFPIPFPNSCLTFLVSLLSSNTANQTAMFLSAQGASLSNSTYQCSAWGGGGWYTTAQVQWLAIGF